MISLYSALAESQYLSGDFEAIEAISAIILAKIEAPLDATSIYEIRILSYHGKGHLLDGLSCGLQFLKTLGVEIPIRVTEKDTQQELTTTLAEFNRKSTEELVRQPTAKKSKILAIQKILWLITSCAYKANPQLMPVIICKLVNLTISHGNSALAASIYAVYGMLLCGLQDFESGYRAGEVALGIRSNNPQKEFEARVLNLVFSYIMPWKRLLKESIPYLKIALISGAETGDIEYTSYAAIHYCQFLYLSGANLETVERNMQAYCELLGQIKQEAVLQHTLVFYQTVLNLMGYSEEPTQLDGTAFKEIEKVANLKTVNNRYCLGGLYINKLVLSYLFGQPHQGLEYAAIATEYADGLLGEVFLSHLYFYRALSALAIRKPKSTNKDKSEGNCITTERVIADLEKLKEMAANAPMNFGHQVCLIEAEQARCEGQKLEALELYDRAIAGAKANEYIQEESLANELAAQFYLDWGLDCARPNNKEKIAAVYLQEAYYCYTRWGAKAKVTDLETRYPHLLRPIVQEAAGTGETLQALSTVAAPDISIHSSSSSSNIGEAFDLAGILKATQALAEIVGADELLHRLTQIILQNSGGDRCALILPDEKGVWQVEAIATAKGVDLESAPLEGHGNLPVKLIRYVKNAREILTMDKGKTDLPVRDPYLLQQPPQSLLCLPLLHQGQLAGILYVSNQATAGVFTRDRLLVLNFLCTHAAISLENARLYRNLERRVEEQTAALRQSQYELSDYVENAAISLHWVDKNGIVIWANQTELDFLGYEREEYIGQPIAKFHADREVIDDILVRLANNETLANYEARLRCKDGSIRYVQISSNVFYRDGEFVHTRCFTTDVTRRKLLEREWRASQQRYATLVDMLPTGIFLTDPQGHSRYNNPSCCEMLGLTPAEALGEGWSQTLHPDDREAVFQGWYQAARDRQMPYKTDCRFLHRDGTVVWLSMQAVEEFDLEGNLTGYIGSLTDITERKAAETALNNLVEGTAATTGEDFFPALVRHITTALDVPIALVTQFVGPELQSIAFVVDGELQPNCTYNLPETPCIELTTKPFYHCPQGLGDRFPNNPHRAIGAESYLGVALRDRQGQVLGSLCILDRQPLREPERARQILAIFASRTAAEMQRQRVETALQNLISGTAVTKGTEFFPVLVRYLTEALGVSHALMAERVGDREETLAYYGDGKLISCKSLSFLGTPCEEVYERGAYYCELEPCQTCSELAAMEAKSYLGVALYDRQGNAMGLLCIFHRQTLIDPVHAEQILRVFAARAATELERQRAQTALEQLNRELEQRVEERTRELVRSERDLQTIFNNACDGIIIHDLDGCVLDINHGALELFEATRGQILTTAMTELSAPDSSSEQLSKYFEQAVAGENLEFEWNHQRFDGSTFASEVSFRPVTLGNRQAIVAGIRDISDRKHAENALQEEQLRLKLALDAANMGTWSCTLDTGILIWSDRAQEIFGFAPGTFSGDRDTFVDMIHPDDREEVLAAIAATFTTGAPYQLEYRIHRLDGEIRWLAAWGRMRPALPPLSPQLVGVVVDISDRKQAEEQLQRQAREERLIGVILQRMRSSLSLDEILTATLEELRHILHCDRVLACQSNDSEIRKVVAESVATGCASLMEDRFYQGVSCFSELQHRFENGDTSAYVLNNLEEREIAPVFQDFCTRASVRAKIAVPIARNETLWGLLIVHQCDGPRHWQPWEIDLLGRIANQLAIAIQQADLFERLQQELQERQTAQAKLTQSNQQLALSNRELARATRLKDEFLATMSHELRTPLNSILGMTESLQEGILGTINTPQLHALDTIERSGNRLLNLINDILDLSKIAAEKMELILEPTDAAQLCYSCLPLIQQQARKKNIEIQTIIPTGLPLLAMDEQRIGQVLINLLSNAVKFTPKGGRICLSVQAQFPPEPIEFFPHGFVRIAVNDTGIGIAPENMAKLFQPFVQIDSALSRQYEGTGLGLALVKQIVELHGGRVSATSEVGAGSSFMFDLPWHANIPSPPVSTATPAIAGEATEPQGNASPLVLLAEDDRANIATISNYLEAKGYRLVVAENGQEAVELARELHPHAILMDIQMPVMNGLEAIAQIRQLGLADIPIIALTALAMKGDRERCLEAGANEYLSKPVKLKALSALVQRCLTGMGEG
ncbi:MAG: PAS domain S-box protein [Cyanobacteria bacterium P01_E01_bin.42]